MRTAAWLLPILAITASSPSLSQEQPKTQYPPVRGTREMVGAANNLEVEAGLRMLALGGNAVDAGVAATLAATVTEQSRVGLGGEVPILIKMKGQPVIAISGIGIAPTGATPEFFRNRKPELWEQTPVQPIPAIGPYAALTPGLPAGLLLALEKYGKLSFEQVAAPAIELAQGFPIGEEFAEFLAELQNIHRLWPDSYRFFYPNGRPPKAGEIVRYPSLERTFRDLVTAEKTARGDRAAKIRAVHDAFYKGPLAQRIAAFSKSTGGLITPADMAATKAEVDQPRSTTYRGYTVYKTGFWAQGPVMLQALNILEGYDLGAMGHNTPEYLHTLIEAMKLAFADRDRYYGDPKFSTIPEATLLSKDYATGRRLLIQPGKASLESRPGDLRASAAMVPGDGVSKDADTTCVNVVDAEGNAFSATPSGAWIPSMIAGDTGVPLSVRMESFVLTEGHANLLAPGKRPRVTLTPTLVTRNDTQGEELVLIESTPGGDNQDQALLQTLLNIVLFEMPPQLAVEAPRFESEHYYDSFGYHEIKPGRVTIEGRISRTTMLKLAEWGHVVIPGGDWSNTSAPTVILRKDGALHGAADPRRARFIMGR